MLHRNSTGPRHAHLASPASSQPPRRLLAARRRSRPEPSVARGPALCARRDRRRCRARAASAWRPLQRRLAGGGRGGRDDAGPGRRGRSLARLSAGAGASLSRGAGERISARSQSIAKGRARWSSKHAPLYVAGEEAGGNLAAALALMARDRRGPALAGQILFSPMLDACLGTYSLREADAGPVGCRWADGWADYLGSPDKAAHPYAAPLNASRLAGARPRPADHRRRTTRCATKPRAMRDGCRKRV